MHIEFKNADSVKERKALIQFAKQYDLGYINYNDWLDKTEYQLLNDEKGAKIAIVEKKIAGNLIYQTILNEILELKNIRVHEYLQRRGFAYFMLRQLECEASKNHKGIIVDTRKDNIASNILFKKSQYKLINQKNLYDKLNIDNVYYKDLTPNLKTLIY